MSTASPSIAADPSGSEQPDTDQVSAAAPDTTDTAGQGSTDAAAADLTLIPPPEAVAEYKNPNDLVIDENVRMSFDLDDYPDQEASIRARGVRAPALAQRGPDGTIRVYDGQLRVLLARKVGLESVPVWIAPADPDIEDNEHRIERTLDQITLNDRRIPLSEVDRARGIALMLELGATPTRIAHGLQRKRSEITKVGAIGASPTATQLLGDRKFDLDQLSVIADYEARGDTDAVARLESAGRYNFGYTRRLIDNERTTTKDRLETALAYAVYGFGILTSEPDTDTGYLPIDRLVTEAGEPVTVDHLYADPTRWVVWLAVERGTLLVDTESGVRVEIEEVDWSTRGNPDAVPSEGLRHTDTVTRADEWTPTYYLPEKALPGSGFTIIAPEHDPDAEAAAVAAREQARLDRRRVRVLNERGEAANEHRREFLPRLLTGATLPPDTAAFVAETLAHRLAFDERAQVASLLGIDSSTEALVAAIGAASPNRAWKIVLAMQVAIAELAIGKSLWRDARGSTQRYLRFLAEAAADLNARTADNDFALVDVEQAAARLIDYRDIDIES
ncbi:MULTISPECIES: ParB/RepB/Spo0J family partition protein [Nocardia]|uniref:ParB/RepB/Spo0J family partition protein n=1 Tax=Nocardia TaxID=1817 RepID=UPI000D69F1EF|nr:MULTISPECIES: ParB/Srx family N-terminal domain-containing protein [Nocardia]